MSKQSVTCMWCGGSGECPKFAHIADGVCFHCAGKGTRGTVDARRATTTVEFARTQYRALVTALRNGGDVTERADLLARAAITSALPGDAIDGIATTLARIDVDALRKFQNSYGWHLARL
jgi:hypothetical protein